jgi:hypothetical protein
MEADAASSCLQSFTTGLYTKPDESNWHSHTVSLKLIFVESSSLGLCFRRVFSLEVFLLKFRMNVSTMHATCPDHLTLPHLVILATQVEYKWQGSSLRSFVCRSLLPNILQTSSRRSQWPPGLRPRLWSLGLWDLGFESWLRHGCLSSILHHHHFFHLSPYNRRCIF